MLFSYCGCDKWAGIKTLLLKYKNKTVHLTKLIEGVDLAKVHFNIILYYKDYFENLLQVKMSMQKFLIFLSRCIPLISSLLSNLNILEIALHCHNYVTL